jgi:hypothetical protein
MSKVEMLDTIISHYEIELQDKVLATYSLAGALSAIITEDQLARLIKMKGIK